MSTMLDSESFAYAVARPLDEVYEFLFDPANYGKWAFAHDAAMRHLGGCDWAVETTVGPRIVRFPARNRFGVLDLGLMKAEGDPVHTAGLWVIANGGGTELIYTNFRWPGMTELEWASAKTWITADYMALQSLLESCDPIAPMLPARVVSLAIQRGIEEVYEFLVQPENFARWAFVGDTKMRHLADNEWSAETSVGPRTLDFARRNDFFVLTHTSRPPGEAPHTVPMRLIANGDGAQLIYVFTQYPGLGDAEWQSMMEWVTADLGALKSYLESEG
jgi:uncharacterized protein YndB with AHSA1/START domain